jgi:arylsulfatase A-like enzyme
VKSDSLHVVDVTPTIAAILGLPASSLWTGHPAIDGPPMRPAAAGDYPPPGGFGDEPERINEALIERLRALGYLE